MNLRHTRETELGLRNLALTIEAPRFRHLGQALRDLASAIVAGAVFLGLIDVFVSPFLRAWWIGAGM